jgi:DNA-binding CsgD family transcriptional regulator
MAIGSNPEDDHRSRAKRLRTIPWEAILEDFMRLATWAHSLLEERCPDQGIGAGRFQQSIACRERDGYLYMLSRVPDCVGWGLTDREEEVCILLRRYLPDPEIAEMAGMAVNTVKCHLRKARRKAGAGDRHALVERCIALEWKSKSEETSALRRDPPLPGMRPRSPSPEIVDDDFVWLVMEAHAHLEARDAEEDDGRVKVQEVLAATGRGGFLYAFTRTTLWALRALKGLSGREREVFSLILRHLFNKEIALILRKTEALGDPCLCVETVRTHIRNIFRKTGTGNRDELAGLAAVLELQEADFLSEIIPPPLDPRIRVFEDLIEPIAEDRPGRLPLDAILRLERRSTKHLVLNS